MRASGVFDFSGKVGICLLFLFHRIAFKLILKFVVMINNLS